MVKQSVMVMIPAYNEEKTVGEIVRTTKVLYPDFEVVVIDDGSDDRTVEKAKAAGAPVISLPFHCGGSVAILVGYYTAAMNEYDYVVKIDADGQHRPEDIPKLLTPLFSGKTDITVGSRYLNQNNQKSDSAVKNSGRVFSSTLISIVKRTGVTDVTSGMRAWSQKAIRTLLSVYMERRIGEDSVFWVAETFVAAKKGLSLTEVPIEVLPRNHGKSKSFSPRKMLLYPLRLLATIINEIP